MIFQKRTSVILILSLALWVPSMLASLTGDLDIATAGLRYVLALGFSWMTVHILISLIGGYMATQDEAHEDAPLLPESPPRTAHADQSQPTETTSSGETDPARKAPKPAGQEAETSAK